LALIVVLVFLTGKVSSLEVIILFPH